MQSHWDRWLKLSTFRRLSAEQTTGIDWRKADGTKDHPVWASVPRAIDTEPSKYDLVVLLALNPIRVYESIILSGIAETEYGRLPWLALSVLGGHTSNAASEGCHSIAQLIMSDFKLQTSMPVSVTARRLLSNWLQAIYPDDSEAKNAELDITAKFKVVSSSWHRHYTEHRGTGSSSSAQHGSEAECCR